MELLQTLEIPNFPLRFKVSNKQKAKYWKRHHKNRPKKYENYQNTDKEGYLLDQEGNRLLKNPDAMGTPKYVSLSGNNFTTGLHPSVRSGLVHNLKDFYMPYVRLMKPFQKFPLIVEWDFYAPVDRGFDMSNFWFYYKYLEDCLFMTEYRKRPVQPILPDDDRAYVVKPGAPLLWPVDTLEQRKFVFKFYHDNRPLIQNHPLWKAQHQNTDTP